MSKKYNVNLLDRELLRKLSRGEVTPAEAKGVQNTAEYNRSNGKRFFVLALVMTILMLAIFLLKLPHGFSDSIYNMAAILAVVSAVGAVVRAFFIYANTQYIDAVRAGYSQALDIQMISSNDGAWGKPDDDSIHKGATLETICEDVKKRMSREVTILFGSGAFMLALMIIILTVSPSNTVLLWIGGAFALFGLVCLVYAISIRNKSQSTNYILQDINRFCEQTNSPKATLQEINNQLRKAAVFEKAYFCEDYIIVVVVLTLKIYYVADVVSADMLRVDPAAGTNKRTEYYLRMSLRDVKKPVKVEMAYMAIHDALAYMSKKYPNIQIVSQNNVCRPHKR